MPDIFTSHPEKKDEPKEATQPTPPPANTQPAETAQEQHTQSLQETAKPEHNLMVQKDAKEDIEHPAKEVIKHERNPVTLLSHYCEHPAGVHFVNQENNEEIVLFLRRHFATNIPWLIITFLLLFLPPIVYALFSLSNFTLFAIPISLVVILVGFYYLIVFNYALLNFITWFYDMGIVSKKRLIDLDANNILHHHWAETEIGDIVDVSVTQQGFFQSFWNYGNVHIQTEAVKANFEFVSAPKPSSVSDIISDLKEAVTGGKKKHE
jgi:hypothetical protein